MKILFDPIFSAQPNKCSSSAKYKRIAERLLAEKPDTFIYWLIPDWIDEAATAWLPDSPRIHYVKQAKWRDRVREYQILYRELEDAICFNGSLWDFDVIITMRTQQVASMRVLMMSTRNRKNDWTKKLILLEEMAVFSWRKTVPVSYPASQDMLSVLGYLYADRSLITIKHVRDGIMRTARSELPPSKAKEIDKRLTLVSPALIEGYNTKPEEDWFKRGVEPFCLGFVGRMSNSMTRLPEIYDVMEKHWITKGDLGFKVIISTVSTATKLPPPEFVVMENNPRDVFWARVKKDMHLIISMSIDAEFSMSLIEPLILGTPLVVAREPWTEALLGVDYPFFINGALQAYAMIKEFHDNYAVMYGQFVEWRETIFKPRFLPGGAYQNNMYDVVSDDLKTWEDDTSARIRDAASEAKANNEIVGYLVKEADKHGGELHLFAAVASLIEQKLVGPDMRVHLAEDARNVGGRFMPFMADWNNYRLLLKAFHGFEDASIERGHLRRKAVS